MNKKMTPQQRAIADIQNHVDIIEGGREYIREGATHDEAHEYCLARSRAMLAIIVRKHDVPYQEIA